MAAAADCRGQRRFTVACGVLSRHVRADAEAAKTRASPPTTMLLMPGADIANEEELEPAHAPLTIVYGGHVVVFDDVPEDRAEKLVRVASVPAGGLADMRMARKASLRRFMEKRRDRIAARAPYAGGPSLTESSSPASNSNKGKAAVEADAGSWLGLDIAGGCGR